jgi:hypothetical protein
MLLGLTTQRRLAGIFILSGYIPLRKKTKEVGTNPSVKSQLPLTNYLPDSIPHRALFAYLLGTRANRSTSRVSVFRQYCRNLSE